MARVDEGPGRDQEVDALRDDQLAHEDDPRPLGLRQPAHRGRGFGGVAVPRALAVGLCVRAALQLVGEVAQALGPVLARDRLEQLGVDAGRAGPHLGVHLGLVHRLAKALGDVVGADQDPSRRARPVARHRPEALELGDDRVGEVRAVDLDGERHPRPLHDQRRGHQVVRKRRIRRPGPRDDVAHGVGVRLDVALELIVGQLGDTSSPRSPRSGRGRRPAGGRRCRACRRSLSPRPRRAPRRWL